ncbi:gp45 (plasmid) [Bacillus cereus W]|uniref:phage replisome organizer N-terminal domain-containing protein n=1 Tax=Bacillus anthracis TaxID=1392 RepID=UPI00016B50DF|nr:phage replisome organizer N-terminal domain-containing protein [Bacillus anthracis]EDX54271.1 gp45 [Bacillus cereus W]MEB9530350.1 phage replisome organizer N-terminal domain-containing protein [Bacillus anthracis]MEC0043715.1 phage replisome organizer N-terminal domain-containing protein [Bacillus anthracis]
MADVKWIKLSTSMFEDEKIRLIESLPEADTLLIIWIKLLSQAGRTNANGYIFLSENIPFTEEMLSTLFNRPIATVRLALQTFKQFGMIDITDDQYICISNWEKHQNVDGLEKIREQNRLRKQKQREKEKQYLLGNDMGTCAYCGDQANTLDHLIPKSHGGLDTQENCVSCCKQCNETKTNRPIEVFLNECLLLGTPVLDLKSVLSNKKIMNLVDYQEGKFLRHVTGHGTRHGSHATDIEEDKELDIDKEKDKKKKEKPSRHKFETCDTNGAKYLFEKIKGNNHKQKEPNFDSWANDFRLMREKDNRELQEIKDVIDWCQADPFWQGNILSPKKLREKFDQLTIQMNSKKGAKNNAESSGSNTNRYSQKGEYDYGF